MIIGTKSPWPLGAHRGKPAHSLPSPYLLWVLTTPNLRDTEPGLCRVAVAILRDRFFTAGRIEEELGVAPGVVDKRGVAQTGAAVPGGGEALGDALAACEPEQLPELW